MNIVVEAFDKKSELLVHEIIIENEYLSNVLNAIGLTQDEQHFLMAGAGGFDLDKSKIRQIEYIIGQDIYSERYDFQLGTS